jgi:protein required for attachment to host cells
LVADDDQAYIFKYSQNEIVLNEKTVIQQETERKQACSAQPSVRKKSLNTLSEGKIEFGKYRMPALPAKLKQAFDEYAFDYLVIAAPQGKLSALQNSLRDGLQNRILDNMPEGFICERLLYNFYDRPRSG